MLLLNVNHIKCSHKSNSYCIKIYKGTYKIYKVTDDDGVDDYDDDDVDDDNDADIKFILHQNL